MSTHTAPPATGADIKSLRVALGLTQVDLAKASGIDQSSISRIERGLTVPTPVTMRRLREALVMLDPA